MRNADQGSPVPLVFHHRRNWRRLWIYCRRGRRWGSCPYRELSVLMPQSVPAVAVPPRRPDAHRDPVVPAPPVGRRRVGRRGIGR